MSSRPARVRRSRALAVLALALAVWLPACAGSSSAGRPAALRFPLPAEHSPPARDFDVEHYAIDLALAPESESIEATCRVRLLPRGLRLQRVELDLVGLEVRGVRDESGRELAHRHQDGRLAILLAEPLDPGNSTELAISYGGRPRTGLWFSGHDERGLPTQVFTHGQAKHSRGWFPCYDHPSDRATSEVRVTMPAGWVSTAPGTRIDRFEAGGTVTEHWRMDTPHPSYLLSLVAGELVLRQAEWEGVPLHFLAEPRYAEWMDASFEETDEVLAFFSELTGLPYPYPKYSQAAVANFPWGGMENISATTLTPLTFTDERGQRDGTSHALVAHEAAHQWFGDLLTCEDWSHVWLNEGFATYLTELYFEETRGADEFRARMRDAQDRYLAAAVGPARRATVSDVYREPEDLFDAVVYEGAASRLHLLRFVLGDEPFRAGVRRYLAQNAGRSVVTGDLIGAFEEETGEELDGFFDQWFFSRGHPEFEVEWSWDGRAGLVHLDVRQTQDTEDGTPAVFRTPVLVEVREDSGSALHRLEIDERAERFVLPAPSEPLYVRFDVNGWIPKTVTWKRSPGEWIAIAAADADVNGRRDAVRALGELAGAARDTRPAEHERCGAALAERLRGDGSEWVRAGAATAAGRAGGEETRARLEHAAQADPAARVRVAALEALRAWGADPGLAELGRRVFDQGYSWATMGAAAGLVCAADPRSAFDWIRARLPRSSPHDRLRAHLLEHLAGLPEAGVQAELLRWAQDATTDPTARAAAVRGLARPGRNLVAVVRALSGLLDERSFRLRQAVVLALAELGDPRARGALAEYYPRSASSSERRAIEAALTRAGG